MTRTAAPPLRHGELPPPEDREREDDDRLRDDEPPRELLREDEDFPAELLRDEPPRVPVRLAPERDEPLLLPDFDAIRSS